MKGCWGFVSIEHGFGYWDWLTMFAGGVWAWWWRWWEVVLLVVVVVLVLVLGLLLLATAGCRASETKNSMILSRHSDPLQPLP